MAKLSSVHGRRLRSVAVAGLIIGATGAFTTGYAHAAVQPAPITGSIAVSVGNGSTVVPGSTTGGTLVINVDGGNITFNGSTNTASGDSFNSVSGPGLINGTVTSSDLSFTSTNGDGTCTAADFVAADTTLNVKSDGSDTVSATCHTSEGSSMTLTLAVSANGIPVTTPAATPELGSGELLATGLVPALGIILFRRRRQRRAAK